MISFRVVAEIKDDRQVILDIPAHVAIGEAELFVTVDPHCTERRCQVQHGIPPQSFEASTFSSDFRRVAIHSR